MRARAGIVVIFCLAVCLSSLTGCDEIKKMLQIAPSGGSSSSGRAAASRPQGTVLATINGEIITLESFEDKISNLASLDVVIDSVDDKKAYLNDLVLQQLIYEEAVARGIDKKKEVREAIEEFSKGAMARELIMDETRGINVEPSEVETYYNQFKDKMAMPTQASVREIVVPVESDAKEAMISLLGGTDFSALAKEKSRVASAADGGDLGFYAPDSKFEKYNEVVQTLEPGQFSQYFSGPDGYYIVKVEEKKGGSVPQLTEKIPGTDATYYDYIKETLLAQKRAQRIQDLTDRLRRDGTIEIKDELLS